MDFEKAAFQPCKEWVKKMRDDGKDWDEIDSLCTAAENLEAALEEHIDGCDAWPEVLTVPEWHNFVAYYKNTFQPVRLENYSDEIVGLDSGETTDFSASIDNAPSWVKYKETLASKMSSDSIGKLEKSCKWILSHLKRDTKESGPVKGLVMGSVQSGKTANMVGLISMAAALDWNFFIVLSGTIDNLRIQTRDRFAEDLQTCEGIKWHMIDFAGVDKAYSQADLRLNPLTGNKTFSNRYVTVCLKNSRRLTSLIDWLYSVQERTGKLRIVVIDDEADQASINTAEITEEELQERKAINQLIVNLVNGLKSDGSVPTVPFQAINYVSYTATPYANVLNEAPGKSLYPSDFICSLPESDEYFGAKVIFGNGEEEYPGFGITREIPQEDVAMLKSGRVLPESLKTAIAWFLSVCAVRRINGAKQSISMLVHTSAKQNDHFRVFDAIKNWLMGTPIDVLLSYCEKVYDAEKDKITTEDIRLANPKYNVDSITLTECPAFADIRSELREIISEITSIKLDDENKIYYTDGLHLCVDNCSANRWAEEGTRLRIVYPKKEQLASMKKAPLFLVVGGNTLSRGLTLDGLVCSYFSRDVNQADTLMQMARWFGYRSGFEILQRIWLTNAVYNKFEALARIDTALKLEIERFVNSGLSPAEFGPKIILIPEIAKFRITAANRMQRAIPCNFSGYAYETTDFDEDSETLRSNYELTEDFVGELQKQFPGTRSNVKNAMVWREVPVSFVTESFLKKYSISRHSHLHDNIGYLLDWVFGMNKEGKLQYWNVALVDGENQDGEFVIDGAPCGAVERTRKTASTHLDIGSLRSGPDVLADVITEDLTDEQKAILQKAKKSRKDLVANRSELNLKEKPLLLLYRIKKDGGTPKPNRLPLHLPYDIIGISIVFSEDASKEAAVQVAMKPKENE